MAYAYKIVYDDCLFTFTAKTFLSCIFVLVGLNLQFLSLLHVLKAFYHNYFSHLFNYIFKNNQLFSNSLNRQPKNHLHRRNYATYHYPRMDEISFYNPESRIVYEEKLHNLSDIPSLNKFSFRESSNPRIYSNSLNPNRKGHMNS